MNQIKLPLWIIILPFLGLAVVINFETQFHDRRESDRTWVTNADSFDSTVVRSLDGHNQITIVNQKFKLPMSLLLVSDFYSSMYWLTQPTQILDTVVYTDLRLWDLKYDYTVFKPQNSDTLYAIKESKIFKFLLNYEEIDTL